MFALVESGSITKMLNGNQGIQIGDLKYPRAIYTLWTEAERNAIGIYTVEYDDSNKKDEKWYINTNQSYAFADNKVTASYGTATAKAHADTLYTQEDEDNGLGTKDELKLEGLKTILIRKLNHKQLSELQEQIGTSQEKQKKIQQYQVQSQLIEMQLDQNKQQWKLQSQTQVTLLR